MKITNFLIISAVLTIACVVVGLSFFANVFAQGNGEKAVADILRQNAKAFEEGDLKTLDKIWLNSGDVTVFESGHANYGWADYRNNHLAPEMKEIENTKYSYSDIKVKVDKKTAWATLKYTISGDADGKHFDGGGLGTAILEKNSKNQWQIVHWHSSSPRRQPNPSPSPAK